MKGLFLYNTTNGITTLQKHANANHFIIAKLFEEAINSPLKGKVERKLAQKISSPSSNVIVNFFVAKNPFQKDYMQQTLFLEIMGLLIIKHHLPMQFVKSLCMKRLCLDLCPRLAFLSKKKFSQKMFLKLVEKTKQFYILPTLVECNFVIVSFDLWMSNDVHDIFALLINFLGGEWQPKHVTFGLFEYKILMGRFWPKS